MNVEYVASCSNNCHHEVLTSIESLYLRIRTKVNAWQGDEVPWQPPVRRLGNRRPWKQAAVAIIV